MSVTATFWVRAQRVGKGSPKAVLIALADFAGEDFRVWASMDAIEQFIEQDRKTVLANIKRLLDLGYLEDTGERTGRTRQIIVYQMTRPANASKVQMTNRDGKVVEIGPPLSKLSQKRNSSENGTVPDSSGNSPKFPPKQSQISAETVPKTGHGTTKELPEEQKGNDQPARRAPRVALSVELREREIPDWLPRDVWLDWCEHREAKETKGGVPWTRPAAKVTIEKLEKLHSRGIDVVPAVKESVLRGWAGIWEAKDEAGSAATGGAADGWWLDDKGWREQGKRLGIDPARFQFFEQFKAKVCKTLGPGAWMEHLLAAVSRESEERGEALYAYFNDIPREKAAPALAEAA